MRNNYALMGLLLTVPLSTWLHAEHQPLEVKSEESSPADRAGDLAPAKGVTAADTAPPTGGSNSFWQQEFLTGNWGGARTKLADKGVSFGVNYIGEVFGNPSGGISQGVVNNGRIEMVLDLDFEKMAGFKGGTFHVNSYYIYGEDLSATRVGNGLTVSNIAAYNTLRLFDLWYQQEFLDGRISVRFGQIAADDEFIVSDYGATMINGTFGWPALVSANMASGGPGFPLATPGVRVMVTPIEQVSFMGAIFDGDPGDGGANPQKKNSTGTRIDFAQGLLTMFEGAYHLNQEKDAKGLPGTYKLGGWFGSQSAALSYTNFNTGANENNWGVYAVADQMVWREPTVPAPSGLKNDPKDVKAAAAGADAGNQGIGLFARVGGSPADRNTLEFYADGGLNYTGLIPGRDEDVLGFGVAYAQISDVVSNLAAAPGTPTMNFEMVLEATYQAKITPWWTVQPDIQYIINPGGKTPDPNNPAVPIPNAVVLGLRTAIAF